MPCVHASTHAHTCIPPRTTRLQHRDVGKDADVNVSDECVTYSFLSAWRPPTGWLKTVGEKYPSLSFELTYAESGCDFRGRMVVENGGVVLDEETSYYHEATRQEADAFISENNLMERDFTPSAVDGLLDEGMLQEWCQEFSCDDEKGPPDWETLGALVREILTAFGETVAWERFVRSALALVVLQRAARRFKEKFYAPTGAFEQIGASRFTALSSSEIKQTKHSSNSSAAAIAVPGSAPPLDPAERPARERAAPTR